MYLLWKLNQTFYKNYFMRSEMTFWFYGMIFRACLFKVSIKFYDFYSFPKKEQLNMRFSIIFEKCYGNQIKPIPLISWKKTFLTAKSEIFLIGQEKHLFFNFKC